MKEDWDWMLLARLEFALRSLSLRISGRFDLAIRLVEPQDDLPYNVGWRWRQ